MEEYRQRSKPAGGAVLSTRAVREWKSQGRALPEPEDDIMSCYQVDRSRIVHSKAFRRLAHKTQVFLAPEGDHYRVRLTHTLEVTEVARTIARALRLNEDLVEAICLGHDLGHTPFGHLGEEVVAAFYPGFRHNLQSLRIVDVLEGLNLTWEVRDGIANHTWSMPTPPATLEGQVARYADRIAYINHDIDDAVRAGILDESDLPGVTRTVLGGHSERIRVMVGDLVASSAGADEIRMSPEVFEAMAETRSFLFENVYVGRLTEATLDAVAHVLRSLLDHFERHPPPGPPPTAQDHPRARAVDYVAGMTDRFALKAFEALVGEPSPPLGVGAALG